MTSTKNLSRAVTSERDGVTASLDPSVVARSHVLQELALAADRMAERPIAPTVSGDDRAYLEAWRREALDIARKIRTSPGFRMPTTTESRP